MAERTQEFMQFCVQINKGGDFVRKVKSVAEVPKSKTAFNEAAADIAKGIHKTSTVLSKLTNLIKRQGLFDDPTEEINNLIYRIKQDLDELNSKCDTAEEYIQAKKSIFSNDAGQSAKHNVSVVSHLKSDLMHATKDFKTVLEMRQSKMKNQQDRRLELTGKGNLSPMRIMEEVNREMQKLNAAESDNKGNVSATGSAASSSSAVTHRSNKKNGFASPYGNMQPYDIHANHGDASNMYATSQSSEHAQQHQHLLLAPINSEYYDQREQATTEVQKTIGEHDAWD